MPIPISERSFMGFPEKGDKPRGPQTEKGRRSKMQAEKERFCPNKVEREEPDLPDDYEDED